MLNEWILNIEYWMNILILNGGLGVSLGPSRYGIRLRDTACTSQTKNDVGFADSPISIGT